MISPIVLLLENSPPYPLLWIAYQCTSPKYFPLELRTKPEATRDAFLVQVFFLLLCT